MQHQGQRSAAGSATDAACYAASSTGNAELCTSVGSLRRRWLASLLRLVVPWRSKAFLFNDTRAAAEVLLPRRQPLAEGGHLGGKFEIAKSDTWGTSHANPSVSSPACFASAALCFSQGKRMRRCVAQRMRRTAVVGAGRAAAHSRPLLLYFAF